MDRRNFIGNLFATGAVAVLPHSILNWEDNTIQETVVDREIDFSKYKAVLLKDGNIIAYSQTAGIELEQELIKKPRFMYEPPIPYEEYMPGLRTFKINMYNTVFLIPDDQPPLISQIGPLQFLIQDESGTKFSGDCYIIDEAMNADLGGQIIFDLRLKGSGELLLTLEKG